MHGRVQEQRAAIEALVVPCIVSLADAIPAEQRAGAEADAAQEPDATQALEATERRAGRAGLARCR